MLDHPRWTRLWRQVNAAAAAGDRFTDLQRRYAEPTRFYHTAQHIADCLSLFDEVREQVCDPVALELAIWFHDAIYDPRAADNEERSAHLAHEAIAGAEGGPELAARVHVLVLATKHHQPGADPDAPWLLDIDLAILGQPAGGFAAYEAAIRREYAWVPEAEFRTRRASILEGFLARPSIYQTTLFRERCEDVARRNLRSSVEQLRR